MLAEILANPVAWPLWAVLAFAVTMYPLGLLMPGCVCCGTSGCTQCGVFATGYAAGQDANGRMCCTGTIAPTITVRVTNVGPATSSFVTRTSLPPTSSYSRRTAVFNCSQMNADYVLPLSRQNFGPNATCSWSIEAGVTCDTGDYRLMGLGPSTQDPTPPNTTATFPNWWLLTSLFVFTLRGSSTTQICTGHPGVESCNTGSSSGFIPWFVSPEASIGVLISEQRCNPAGTVIGSSVPLWTNESCQPRQNISAFNTGCLARIEIV